jgi:hypothetical protein
MSLKNGDLRDMLYDVFEVDSFASKMGSDEHIVTLSFSVKERLAAEDLMNFVEKGYDFVLDADVTSGEQSDGTYKVFVEIERDKSVHDNILEIIDGVGKLSNIDKFRFRYYKNWKSKDCTDEALREIVPTDSESYGIRKSETQMENYKNFFTNSYVESIDLLEDTVFIKKAYADQLVFEFIDFGDTLDVLNRIEGKFDIMESYPEILFLTKYIGDYNISKYGDKLVFENKAGKSLVVKRI